jgi:hypothetical protein
MTTEQQTERDHALERLGVERSWASPNRGGSASENILTGVAATSASDVWAVGYYFKQGVAYRTLTLHWAGSGWTTVRSPNASTPGDDNFLNAIAASGSDLWAVGEVSEGSAGRTLIEHRTGIAMGRAGEPEPRNRVGRHRRTRWRDGDVRRHGLGGWHLLPRRDQQDPHRGLGRSQLDEGAEPKPGWPRWRVRTDRRRRGRALQRVAGRLLRHRDGPPPRRWRFTGAKTSCRPCEQCPAPH